jgi:hypothetical protein
MRVLAPDAILKAMKKTQPEWEAYERMVARLAADQIKSDLCVTPNARVTGKISGRSRQVDVLIDARHDTDNSRRIIVDAKKRKRKIDVKDVESFLGLMQDAGATHGYLVSPAGHTKAAEKRAQMAVSIRIVPVDRLANFDPSTWPKCRDADCKHGRVFWDGYPELSVALRPVEANRGQREQLVAFLHYIGKCDRCGLFHVWCTRCDAILPVPHQDGDDGHQCSCKPPWFWLASTEEDGDGARSVELHAVLATGRIITVDRRPS